MDPLLIFAMVIAGIELLCIVAYVVLVVLLCIGILVALFDEWVQENSFTEDDMVFVTQQVSTAVSSGKYSHIQGVLNTKTKTIRGAWKIKAESVDSELQSRFKNADVILIT